MENLAQLRGRLVGIKRHAAIAVIVLAVGFMPVEIFSTPKNFDTAASPAARRTPSTGQVLIVGGICNKKAKNGSQKALSFSELYDPETKQFSATGRLHESRAAQTATVLNDGHVLVAGGD